MRYRGISVFVIVLALVAAAYYAVEPWAVTFVDDGPYYSREYTESITDRPVRSRLVLERFGRPAYSIESRSLPAGDASVLVLRATDGAVAWARLPVKPDGELGAIELVGVRGTWYGGWRITIRPDNQEIGQLYLSPFGKFRFFNHSW